MAIRPNSPGDIPDINPLLEEGPAVPAARNVLIPVVALEALFPSYIADSVNAFFPIVNQALTPLVSLFSRAIPNRETFLGAASFILSIFKSKESREIHRRLDLWEKEDPANRREAKNRILMYLTNPSSELNLSRLPIISLPDIFSFEPFTTQLTRVNLHNSSLLSFPESFSNLTALTYLNLSGTKLRSLPTSFGNLTALTYLDLSATKILDLPDSFGNLTALTHLDLSSTPIRDLLESFGNLTALTYLNLSGTPLRSLPEPIRLLRSLIHLDLSGATIRNISDSILNLNQELTIDLTGCPLSPEIVLRLRENLLSPDYQGPQFNHSALPARTSSRSVSLEESLTRIYIDADIPQEPLPNLLSITEPLRSSLAIWLNRLKETADGKSDSSPARRKAFYKIIIEHLKFVNLNSDFREGIFATTIREAVSTCGDRVSLSVLTLGIQKQLIQVDKTNLRAIITLLRSLQVLSLLETVAINKIAQLRPAHEARCQELRSRGVAEEDLPVLEEIEIYLGFFMKFKEIFNLPLDVEHMQFFGCSAITDQDLKDAEIFVSGILNNQNAVAEFLVSREEWKECLQIINPKRYQAIEDAKRQALEVDNPNYEEIDKAYKKAFHVFTIETLPSKGHLRG